MNRYLGIAGVVLQYAALANRALWLEELFCRWNLRKQADLPRLLVTAGYRATACQQQQQQHADRLVVQAAAVVRHLHAKGDVDATWVQRLQHQVCAAMAWAGVRSASLCLWLH